MHRQHIAHCCPEGVTTTFVQSCKTDFEVNKSEMHDVCAGSQQHSMCAIKLAFGALDMRFGVNSCGMNRFSSGSAVELLMEGFGFEGSEVSCQPRKQ